MNILQFKKHISIILLILFCYSTTYAQSPEKPNYNLQLVKVAHTDTIKQNSVVAVFAVTPIKMKDFPPVLSMRIVYQINEEPEMQTVNIQKQERKAVKLIIYGKTIIEKAPKLYQLIKADFDIDSYEAVQFLVFYFENISETSVNQMSLTYGLWEKRNTERRIEQTFKSQL